MNQSVKARKSSKFSKMMRIVERVGNKLPHPFILFTIFSIIILFLSLILNHYHVGITYYAASKTVGQAGKMVTVTVANLLSKKNMQDLVRDIPTIYVNFPSLKVVIIMMLGIGFIPHERCRYDFLSDYGRRTVCGSGPESENRCHPGLCSLFRWFYG